MLGLDGVFALLVSYNRALFAVVKETFSSELFLALLSDSGPLLLWYFFLALRSTLAST